MIGSPKRNILADLNHLICTGPTKGKCSIGRLQIQCPLNWIHQVSWQCNAGRGLKKVSWPAGFKKHRQGHLILIKTI